MGDVVILCNLAASFLLGTINYVYLFEIVNNLKLNSTFLFFHPDYIGDASTLNRSIFLNPKKLSDYKYRLLEYYYSSPYRYHMLSDVSNMKYFYLNPIGEYNNISLYIWNSLFDMRRNYGYLDNTLTVKNIIHNTVRSDSLGYRQFHILNELDYLDKYKKHLHNLEKSYTNNAVFYTIMFTGLLCFTSKYNYFLGFFLEP